MEFLQQLWMPIVVSAVFLFIASSIIHMVLPIHKGEWKGVPDEGRLMGALEGVGPGQYMFPYCSSMSEMNSPEFKEKVAKGPNGTLVIWPGQVNMGKNLLYMFIFYVVVGLFVAYVGWYGMGAGPHEYLKVFRVCGAAAFMAHGLGWIPYQIWYGGSSRSFWTYTFDSLVYALLTAGTFGWLWPKAVGMG